MKPFSVPLLMLGLALFAWPARADFINGHSYIALTAWARANGFGGYTLNSGQEFVLTNKISRLVFNQDSADSTINGVHVRLSFPVAKGGFLSQLDADKTVRPLIYPPKPSVKKAATICLDPGHGGKDTGYRVGRFFPHYEKTYTLELALELRKQLQQAGFNVILTRDKDVYPELSARPDIANRRGADLFVSLHFNSFPPDPASVQGPETYCITPIGAASSNDAEGEGAGAGACPANRIEDKSLLLAYQVQHSLVRGLGVTDRSVRRARFEVLRTAEMPAILIEGGYMSHPVEGKKIFDAGWRKQMAAAVVRAIVNYQKLTTPPRPANLPVTNRPAIKLVPQKKTS
ncbi:MAG TPA: N-acetylmuramoyl-L-alanine amidase [Verrucomicrobiae bacterium]|jgi:N-acetylmuramoyl-L-alanine amidase|nr:N-acetylmuramoyl-L-alanine amidase [Verrucomicrobiae bacterium]